CAKRRDNLEEYFEDDYPDLPEPGRQAIVASGDDTLLNFSRYEARLERSFHNGLTALQPPRAERKKEMTTQTQPQAAPSPAAAAKTADVGVGHARRSVEYAEPANRQPAIGNRQPATAASATRGRKETETK